MASESTTTSANTKPDNRLLYGIIAVLVVGIVAVGLYIVFSRLTAADNTANTEPLTTNIEDYDGSTPINPPQEVRDFTLTNHMGDPFSLSDLQGKYVLMSFGYTHCPDICPFTLNDFKAIQGELGDLSDGITFVFVSVDGERDTPEALRNYFAVRNIDEGFVGLTGEESELRRIGVDYGLYFELGEPDETGYYEVDHTAGSFLLDREGRWVMRYAYGTDRDIIIEDITAYLES